MLKLAQVRLRKPMRRISLIRYRQTVGLLLSESAIDFNRHELVAPAEAGGSRISVRWLQATDGHSYGKEFFVANPTCRKHLLTGVNVLQSQGFIKNDAQGHWLKGEKYRCLFEFKPYGFRFYAFQVHWVYLITSGARKEPSERRQDRHRDYALKLRREFYDAEKQ